MHILIGIIGIIFFLALAYLFSSDRKNIRWQYVGLLLVIQLIFAFILLKQILVLQSLVVLLMVLVIYYLKQQKALTSFSVVLNM